MNKKNNKVWKLAGLLFVFILLASPIFQLQAQDTEFWFAAPDDSYVNNACDRPTFLVITTSVEPATVTIRIGGVVRRTVYIPAYHYHKEDFTTTADLNLIENSIATGTAGTVQTKGIHIASDNPVSAYYQVNGDCSKDVFTLKGEKALGTSFLVPFQTRYGTPYATNVTDAYNHFVIVATEDNTSVTIKAGNGQSLSSNPNTSPGSTIYRASGGNIAPGGTFTITLNEGQTYTVRELNRRQNDQYGWAMAGATLAGTEVTSTKPIAITVAEPATAFGTSSDLLGDQIVPITGAATNYLVITGFGDVEYAGGAEEWIYVMATENNTVVEANYEVSATVPHATVTLQKGQHWTYMVQPGTPKMTGIHFNADKPILCYHQSAYKQEVGAAVMPNMYSIAAKSLSFFKQTTGVTGTDLFLIFRDGEHGGFTINGNTLAISSSEVISIPKIDDWVYVKKDISSIPEGYCIVENPNSAFAMGVFTYRDGESTAYGFLSSFGPFSFAVDTVYKCEGGSTLLDAGYAKGYAWVFPDGTTATTSTVSTTQEGWHKVTVDHDNIHVTDSIYVKNRFKEVAITGVKVVNPGETHTYYVDLGNDYSANVKYNWSTTGGAVSSATSDTIEVVWTSDGVLTVEIEDEALGCTKVLQLGVALFPDNIVDADCYVDPPATPWSIQLLAQSNATDVVYSVGVPLVGDVDNDGNVEIVVAGGVYPTGYNSTALRIFEVVDNQLRLQQSLTTPTMYAGLGAPFCLANVDGGDYAAIFLCTRYLDATNGCALIKYTFNGTAYTETARVKYADSNTREGGIPYVADFNGDGRAEVVVFDKVYDARTLTLLADGQLINASGMGFGMGGYRSTTYGTYMAVGDMDGDGLPEIAGGNCVYKINITDTTGTAGNSFTLWSKCDGTDAGGSTHLDVGDGCTAIADIDGDGFLDVVVTVMGDNNSMPPSNGVTFGSVYVWNPRTKKVIHRNVINSITISNTYTGPSTPFIGDIDDDGEPEICFTSYNKMYAFEYDKATQTLTQKWERPTIDGSSCTTMSMFDFNQDGYTELVYRDETHLRIINGETGTNITEIPVRSGTYNEYPVVADVNGDGAAEIIVTGCTGDQYTHGQLWIFSSDPIGTWAPARKVWNHFQYNAVNVNEDLTIPKYPLNPATVFPGADGLLGTADDMRPYNGFLMQQTSLDKNGVPLWLTPNGQVSGMHTFDYDVDADSLTVTIEIGNTGDVAFQEPFHITAYKNNFGNATKYTFVYEHTIHVGDTVTLTFGISNFTQDWYPFDRIIIQINDNGDGTNDQVVCDDENRLIETTNIIASDDRVLLFKDYNDQEIDVLRNDLLPSGCTNPTVQVLSSPSYKGSATVRNGMILYTPANSMAASVADTLRYRVYCDDASKADTATVYITIIEKPDNIDDAECVIEAPAMVWGIQETSPMNTTKINNYGLRMIGDIDNDGVTEIIAYSPYNSDVYGNRGFEIFYFDESLKNKSSFTFPDGITTDNRGSAAIARYNDTTYIVVPGRDGYLYAYNVNGVKFWDTTVKYSENVYVGTAATANATNVGVADFNNDGIPEVYAGNKIYSIVDGSLICDGGANNKGIYIYGINIYSTLAVDIDGDGQLELIAGTQIYDVNIGAGTMTLKAGWQLPASELPANVLTEGQAQVVDVDLDGNLDIVVISRNGTYGVTVLVWKPQPNNQSKRIGYYTIAGSANHSTPMIGNIDNAPYPEIIFITSHSPLNMYALRYNGSAMMGSRIEEKWKMSHTDSSGATGATLFDFNQSGTAEIVYRDEQSLRIFDGSGTTPFVRAEFNNVTSPTVREYPIVADIDNDGQAEIIVTGALASGSGTEDGYLRIFKTNAGTSWAPARKVWNQYMYNAVHVNEDLTIPKYQLNPDIVFPGADGILGTADDVRPYNAFLQQQTMLNKYGTPLWLTPDVYPDPSITSTAVIGDSVCVTVGIINEGDAAIGPPVYVALYKESVSSANFLLYDSAHVHIFPGDTGYVDIRIPDIKLLPPMFEMAIRVNDNGVKFMYEEECDSTNNVLTIRNPAIHLLMKKEAVLTIKPSLTTFAHNGTYPNPVSILYGEEIAYTITAVNVNLSPGDVIIRDTLPAYLQYVAGTATTGSGISVDSTFNVPIGSIPYDILRWTLTGVPSMATCSVTFSATPRSGVCSSQPIFVNRAWVTVNNDVHVPTNYTYHQGASISVVTFSASPGGTIYNAAEQALDYMTSPRSGILVVPDDGYRFAGWRHDDYISLRGAKVEAVSGILLYDTLTIYGNAALIADFALEEYVVSYHLNGAANAAENPSVYTIESGAIELQAPTKANDVFVGWTGSNGATLQASVVIPQGTTGALEYYAHFLHSGREEEEELAKEVGDDRIWSVKDELYIHTSKVGGIVHIYSTEGVLQKVHTIMTAGETKLKLSRGLYIVTLDNGIGQKVMIE